MATVDSPPTELVAGKYRLTRLLGRGGMGSVWEGVHSSLGTRVAVKFIENDYIDSTEARERFENEARAAAQLSSKHVVKVYDHGVMTDGRPYIVMEYLAGESLDALLAREGRLSLTQTAAIMTHVCRALARAHEAGIVHRDLKPENVFLVHDEDDGSEIAKVVDFGIAKFTSAASGLSSSTRTGAVLGTPFYMSPEQARGLRSVDWRTDLWAVGVLAYRCVTGELPFSGEAVGDLLVKICVAPLPVPSQRVPGLPATFDAWLARALAREPAERFQNAIELATALSGVAGVPVPALASGAHAASAPISAAVSSAVTVAAPSNLSPVPLPRGADGVTAAPFTQNALPPKKSAPIALIAVGLAFFVVLVGVAGILFLKRGAAAAAEQSDVTAVTGPAAAVPSTPAPAVSVTEPSVIPTTPEPAPAASIAPSAQPAATHPRTTTAPTTKRGTTTKNPGQTKPPGQTDIGY